jgi:hypothetical protein
LRSEAELLDSKSRLPASLKLAGSFPEKRELLEFKEFCALRMSEPGENRTLENLMLATVSQWWDNSSSCWTALAAWSNPYDPYLG